MSKNDPNKPKSHRDEYIEECRIRTECFLAGPGVMRSNFEYFRKGGKLTDIKLANGTTVRGRKGGVKAGVVVAWSTPDHKIYVGVAKCHLKLDAFDRYIGLDKAIKHAKLVTGTTLLHILAEMPHNMQQLAIRVIGRIQHWLAQRQLAEKLADATRASHQLDNADPALADALAGR